MRPGLSEVPTHPSAILQNNPKTIGYPAFMHCQAATILSCLEYCCSHLFSILISIYRCFLLLPLTQTLPVCAPIENG